MPNKAESRMRCSFDEKIVTATGTRGSAAIRNRKVPAIPNEPISETPLFSPDGGGKSCSGDHTRLLYDLSVVAAWSPDEVAPTNLQSLDPQFFAAFADGSRPSGPAVLSSTGVTASVSAPHSLSTLRNLTLALARSFDRLVLSTSVPPALIEPISRLRPEWQLEVSPDGRWLAVIMENRVEFRSKASDFARVHADRVPKRKDRFPKWRRVAWSADSRMFAISRSDGTIEVLNTEGHLIVAVRPGRGATKCETTDDEVGDASYSACSAGDGRSPPSEISDDVENSAATFVNKANALLREPLAVLTFVDPAAREFKDGRRSVTRMPDAAGSLYELLAVGFNGNLRSYHIRLPEDEDGADSASTSPLPSPHDGQPSFCVRDTLSCGKCGPVSIAHKFSFRPFHTTVACGAYDKSKGVLAVAGKAPDSQESPSGHHSVTFWKLIANRPYYVRVGEQASEEEAGADFPEEAQVGWLSRTLEFMGMWRRTTEDFARNVVHTMEFSPDGSSLLTLDVHGRLNLWNMDNSVAGFPTVAEVWSREELAYINREKEYSDLCLADFSRMRDELSESWSPEFDPLRCVAVQWWSDDKAILALKSGAVAVLTVPTMQNALGAHVFEHLNAQEGYTLALTRSSEARLHFLEREVHYLRARVVEGGRIASVRPIHESDEEFNAHLEECDAAAAAGPQSLLRWAGSVGVGVVRSMASVFLWHFDKEPRIPAQLIRLPRRTFRLVRFASTTPEELLHRHIAERDYDAALALAAEFGLNTDPVHQAIWNETQVSLGSIDDYLDKITDRKWVLNACLDRVPASPLAARQLLEYGLHQTDVLDELLEYVAAADVADSGKKSTFDPERVLHTIGGVPDDLALVCEYRLVFLKYLDRLDTFMAIEDSQVVESATSEHPQSDRHLPALFAQKYAQFRDMNVVALAAEFACHERVHALHVLFTRHGKDTLPYRLSILSQIPEVIQLSDYEELLPRPDRRDPTVEERWHERPWRERDWVEVPGVKDRVGWVDDAANEMLSELGITARPYPCPTSDVTTWYIAKAHSIDAEAGLADQALALVRFGLSQGIPGLEDVRDHLLVLNQLIYECAPSCPELSTFVSLRQLEDMSSDQVFRLFLKESDADHLVDDIRDYALPALKIMQRVKHDSSTQGDSLETLYAWILELPLEGKLGWCRRIFHASRPAVRHSHRLITSDRALALLALSCAYSVDSSSANDWAELKEILKCLDIAPRHETGSQASDSDAATSHEDDRTDDNSSPRRHDPRRPPIPIPPPTAFTPVEFYAFYASLTPDRLEQAVIGFAEHVAANDVLERYGFAVVAKWYLHLASSKEAQRGLVVRLARLGSGGGTAKAVKTWANEDWTSLLDDMLKLHDHGCGVIGLLDLEDVVSEYMAGLLASAKFWLAKEILVPSDEPPLLPVPKAESLLLNAAREYFDNANPENGYLSLAYECLCVLPKPTDAMQAELDLISATQRLMQAGVCHKQGMPILPIQVRLAPNRMDLVRRYIELVPDAWNDPSVVVLLAAKLGYRSDRAAETRVYSMLARAAALQGSVATAFELSEKAAAHARQLARKRQRSPEDADAVSFACETCARLAEGDGSTARRARLAALALVFSGGEQIATLLARWRALASAAAREAAAGAASSAASPTAATARAVSARLRNTKADGAGSPAEETGLSGPMSSHIQRLISKLTI